MDCDRFHNQLALSIGYKLINDKRFTLEVEDSDDPWLTLKVQGNEDIRFKASDSINDITLESSRDFQNEIKEIVEAIHQAYINTNQVKFA